MCGGKGKDGDVEAAAAAALAAAAAAAVDANVRRPCTAAAGRRGRTWGPITQSWAAVHADPAPLGSCSLQ